LTFYVESIGNINVGEFEGLEEGGELRVYINPFYENT